MKPIAIFPFAGVELAQAVDSWFSRIVTWPMWLGTKDCLKDLTGGIEYAAKILNEIPQKDIQCSKRASKAEREGNGQGLDNMIIDL
ncbi:hypothetical protein KIL84_000181 [Mauremys mutica]|uniref:Uncharacterized protein n=1 Tax=Mauremys mutica TaxID=74926 RepID=A0A9D3XGY5_9SAUR|nr:hypothetical protein KIL84_000181 [Mauremys mutica]